MPYFTNFDLESTITPLNVKVFSNLLRRSNYNATETEFLIDGFTNSFDIGYQGPTNQKSESDNIPLTIGTKEDL